jgi:hypothetical protein
VLTDGAGLVVMGWDAWLALLWLLRLWWVLAACWVCCCWAFGAVGWVLAVGLGLVGLLIGMPAVPEVLS